MEFRSKGTMTSPSVEWSLCGCPEDQTVGGARAEAGRHTRKPSEEREWVLRISWEGPDLQPVSPAGAFQRDKYVSTKNKTGVVFGGHVAPSEANPPAAHMSLSTSSFLFAG